MSQYKLTTAKVKQIKTEIFTNKCKKYGIKDLAEKHGVSTMQITRIARGECWKDVLPDFKRKKKPLNITPPKVVKQIISALKKKKVIQKHVAKTFNVTESVVSRIKSKYLNN